MPSRASTADTAFRHDFEALVFPPAQFKHREHLRLAYVYLTESDTDTAHAQMRGAILAFLAHHHVDPAKYHETITRAWILAVRHFMARTPDTPSFDRLAEANPVMLDSKIMLTHYSAERLFSPDARATFVAPDLDPIPQYSR
jgi:hypothetical protein